MKTCTRNIQLVILTIIVSYLLMFLTYPIWDGQRITTYETKPWNGVIVTASSSLYFDRLQNLISSKQYWHPELMIIVLDIGLSKHQHCLVKKWNGVVLRSMNVSNYPFHVRFLHNGAWKHIFLFELLQEFESILYLDAGAEIRTRLDPIFSYIEKDGHFVGGQWNYVHLMTHMQTFVKLNTSRANFIDKKVIFCSAGISGYKNSSMAYKKVVVKQYQCALDVDCIEPRWSGRDNHIYEQSVNTILMAEYGFECHYEMIFSGMEMGLATNNPARANNQLILFRRWHRNKPYFELLQGQQNAPQCYGLQESPSLFYELAPDEHRIFSYSSWNEFDCSRVDSQECKKLIRTLQRNVLNLNVHVYDDILDDIYAHFYRILHSKFFSIYFMFSLSLCYYWRTHILLTMNVNHFNAGRTKI